MLHKLKNWFSKSGDEQDYTIQLPKRQTASFILLADGIPVGTLSCEKGDWYFKYTDEFKQHTEEYNLITGFPDLEKTYKSEMLWPFFQVRIPGLKQPAIQEILKNEKIDKENEVELLKRFGQKTISNSYELKIA
jgi:HipA-like protein